MCAENGGCPPGGAAETIEQLGKKVSECRTHGRNACEWTTAILSQNYKFYARRPTSSRGFFVPSGVFRPWRRPTAGSSLQRRRCGGPCAPVLCPKPGAAFVNGRRGGRGRFGAEKSGRLFGENAGESSKSPRLFSKSPQWPSRRRPYTARPFPLCRNRSGAVRAKTRAPPAVCLCRRLRCGEIAVLRRGKSESPLVRFDAKV